MGVKRQNAREGLFVTMGNIITLPIVERQKAAFKTLWERPRSAQLINDFYLKAEDAICDK